MKNYYKVIVDQKGEYFLNKGQKVLYSNNVVNDISNYPDGEICKLYSEDDKYIATGFFSKISHITCRILSYDENEEIDDKFIINLLEKCWNYRKEVLDAADLSNCRIVYGKADNFPGLTIDRYNDVLVSQITIKAIENRKTLIYNSLLEILKKDGQIINAIYERNELANREKEGLKAYKGFYLKNKEIGKTIIEENGVKLNVDFINGQKTGYFLDQKKNRKKIQQMAANLKVLDCFSHTGGFALNAAKGNASKVTAVDVSALALNQGKENAILNGLQDKIDFIQDDVFEYLNKIKKGQFDLIILDPPAFTKSRKTIDHAYNGYLTINTQGFKLLNKGGYLVSASCSRYMEQDNYEKMLKEAAQNAGVEFKQIYFAKQSPDHPVDDNDNDTYYLKFYILEVL